MSTQSADSAATAPTAEYSADAVGTTPQPAEHTQAHDAAATQSPLGFDDAVAAIENLSMDQLASLAAGTYEPEDEPAPASAPADNAGETAPEENAAPAAGQEPELKVDEHQPTATEPEPVEHDTQDDDGAINEAEPLPKNWRLAARDDAEARVFKLLKQEPGISLAEAMRRTGHPDAAALNGKQEATNADPAESANQNKATDPHQHLVDEIESLYTQAEELDNSFQYAEAAKLRKQATDKQLALQTARFEHQLAEMNARLFAERSQPYLQEAVQRYPDLGKRGTAQFVLVDTMVKELQAKNDPILQRPDYAMRILERAEKQYPGVFVKTAATAPTKPNTNNSQPATPATPARPAVGAVAPGSNGNSGAPSHTEVLKALNTQKVDLDTLEAWVDATGTRE